MLTCGRSGDEIVLLCMQVIHVRTNTEVSARVVRVESEDHSTAEDDILTAMEAKSLTTTSEVMPSAGASEAKQGNWTSDAVLGLLDDNLEKFKQGVKKSAGMILTALFYGDGGQKPDNLKDSGSYYQLEDTVSGSRLTAKDVKAGMDALQVARLLRRDQHVKVLEAALAEQRATPDLNPIQITSGVERPMVAVSSSVGASILFAKPGDVSVVDGRTVYLGKAQFRCLPEAKPQDVHVDQHKDIFQVPLGWTVVSQQDPDFPLVVEKVVGAYSWGTHVVMVAKTRNLLASRAAGEFDGFHARGFKQPGGTSEFSFIRHRGGRKFQLIGTAGRLLVRRGQTDPVLTPADEAKLKAEKRLAEIEEQVRNAEERLVVSGAHEAAGELIILPLTAGGDHVRIAFTNPAEPVLEDAGLNSRSEVFSLTGIEERVHEWVDFEKHADGAGGAIIEQPRHVLLRNGCRVRLVDQHIL